MEHADENSVAPREDSWELAEQFWRSELSAGRLIIRSSGRDFKSLRALLSILHPSRHLE